MHKENYNINIACFCNENFTNALIELKTFLGFNLILSENLKEFKNKNINAVIFDNENIKKISSTGVHRISIGQITHSAPTVDCKLDFIS